MNERIANLKAKYKALADEGIDSPLLREAVEIIELQQQQIMSQPEDLAEYGRRMAEAHTRFHLENLG